METEENLIPTEFRQRMGQERGDGAGDLNPDHRELPGHGRAPGLRRNVPVVLFRDTDATGFLGEVKGRHRSRSRTSHLVN